MKKLKKRAMHIDNPEKFSLLTYERRESVKRIRMKDKLRGFFSSGAFKDYRERKCLPRQRFSEIRQEGAIDAARPVAIYAHYNACGTVSEMVCKQIASLKENGYQVVFVSMSRLKENRQLEELKTSATHIIVRKSFGRDFGAWRDIWMHYRDVLLSVREVLLMNDSIVGPIRPLGPLVEKMRKYQGLVGLTESSDMEPHLHSYFLLFHGEEAVAAFDAFIQGLKLSYDKRRMIDSGEIALSRYCRLRGIPVYVAFPNVSISRRLFADRKEMKRILFSIYHALAVQPVKNNYKIQLLNVIDDDRKWQNWLPLIKTRINFTALNVTHFHWKILIDDFDFPFIKVELLTKNPEKVCDLEKWTRMIDKRSDVTVEDIKEHLFMVG